jgi:hypothetical protein
MCDVVLDGEERWIIEEMEEQRVLETWTDLLKANQH